MAVDGSQEPRPPTDGLLNWLIVWRNFAVETLLLILLVACIVAVIVRGVMSMDGPGSWAVPVLSAPVVGLVQLVRQMLKQ